MSHATYMIGDVFDRMAELPDNSVDLVLTSPPFLALRSYLPEDHPNKHKEIGSEPNPAEFVDTLLALSAEWRRVLAPHGSIAVELGDTFSGPQPAFNYTEKHEPDAPLRTKQAGIRNQVIGEHNMRDRRTGEAWPLAKSLALVPEAYRFALAYGHNPHTGTESPAGQWRIRNVIRWVRPNPPVGALGDKFRPATSEMVVATIASDRFFDLDAVRTEREPDEPKGQPDPHDHLRLAAGGHMGTHPAGAPPLDWWKISPKGYAGAHYAVWPAELCIKPIKAMCPEKVCRECGEPSRRIVKQENASEERRAFANHLRQQREAKGLTQKEVAVHFPSASGGVTGCVWNWENAANVPTAEQWPTLVDLLDLSDDFAYLIEGTRQWTESLIEYEHISDHPSGTTQDATGRIYNRLSARKDRIAPDDFTDCGHNNWRPGIVLDPFAGTGTTLAVATGHGRDAIGIDIDERNALLAEERIGPMFLTVEGAT